MKEEKNIVGYQHPEEAEQFCLRCRHDECRNRYCRPLYSHELEGDEECDSCGDLILDFR